MNEIQFISQIFNEALTKKGENPLQMKEESCPEKKEQVVNIIANFCSISDIVLYEFNSNSDISRNLFPFFNKNNDGPRVAPKGLTSFCDYILMFCKNEIPYVFFIELKRGTTEGADIQLNASKCFFEYILKTANRIKDINSIYDFDSSRFRYRRIILKETISNKQITKQKDIDPSCLEDIISCKCYNKFYPLYFC